MLMYSTNVFLKHYIQVNYFKDVHYVWCSEHFDSKSAAKYSIGSLVPASSNPADIYRELKRDVTSGDRHSSKIISQQASLKLLATKWENAGIITQDMKDEIYVLSDRWDFDLWRPLLYIIPRPPVENRLQLVPLTNRAGLGNEYILQDLKGAEFQIIEL